MSDIPAAGGPPPGVRAVFDTNVHLHFPRFDQHDWTAELGGGGPVVVVVPLVVLDRHKNQGRPVLADRAADVTRRIEDLVEEHDGRVDDRLSVRLEPEPGGHVRRPTVDAEIVAVSAALAAGPGPPVVVVTDDAGLRSQARARGLRVHRPRAARLPSTDPAAASLRRDQQEVDRILAARPAARVTFADGEARLLLPPAPRPMTQEHFVASVMGRAERRLPALDVPGQPSGAPGVAAPDWETAVARRSNEQRDAWLRALAEWAAREYERQVRQLNAVDLSLCGRNPGGAAAQDVEVRVELPDRERSAYLIADAVEAADAQPEQPERPTSGLRQAAARVPRPPRLDIKPAWGWEVGDDGRVAVLHVARVLQGDVPRPFGPVLLLVPATGAVARPVTLRWSLTGASPAYRRAGKLTVVPGTPAGEA